MEKFTFDILGQKMNISIKKDDHDEIVKVLKFYRKKVQELEKLYPYKSSLEIAILAGVRITDEYYACYNERTSSIKKEDNNINKILNELGKELDLVIKS
jgi:cell division protein ZapA (FtsZ GTPase activity inhibitor)